MAAYERDDSQKLFDHVAMLQGSALLEVSEWCQKRHSCPTTLLACSTHLKDIQHLTRYASIQLTLERYSHWMPSSIGRHAAEGMNEALG